MTGFFLCLYFPSCLLSIIQVLSGLNDYANNFRIFEDHIRKNTIFVLWRRKKNHWKRCMLRYHHRKRPSQGEHSSTHCEEIIHFGQRPLQHGHSLSPGRAKEKAFCFLSGDSHRKPFALLEKNRLRDYSKNLSASIAAIAPVPAAVIAWR